MKDENKAGVGRSFLRYAWNSLRRGKLGASALRWLRARGAPVTMSWEAYRFDRYQRARWQMLPAQDLQGVRTGGMPGLVSLVLPAYNGERLVREALDSVLAQTYVDWELIAVDDGSTDQTGAILDEYAQRERRIRVIHQANQKLPRALNAGFAHARGEYLTWISCDNRLRPDFLAKMVRALQVCPAWDAVYANLDLIGEDGAPLRNSQEYLTYQAPYGSEHIRLPVHPTELNVRANNTVGAAFLYRERAARLAGAYNPWLYTVEDYDFWMKINELLYLRHAPFHDAVYEYRFHGGSLTSRGAELKIAQAEQQLMLWDNFRRDFGLIPCLWWVHGEAESVDGLCAVLQAAPLSQVVGTYKARAGSVGMPLADEWEGVDPRELKLPEAGLPVVWVCAVKEGDPLPQPPAVPQGLMKVLVVTTNFVQTKHDAGIPERGRDIEVDAPASRNRYAELPDEWDAGVIISSGEQAAGEAGSIRMERRWIETPDVQRMAVVVDILARRYALQVMEARLGQPQPPDLQVTVVVCTHRRVEALSGCLRSLAAQDFQGQPVEVIVVNNARPGSTEHQALAAVLEQARQDHFTDWGERFRWLDCPVPGLSTARNAAVWAARGEVVCFLDDDALAEPDWLRQIWAVFAGYPQAGVVGGPILLREPERKPWWYRSSWKRFWSHFEPQYADVTQVTGWENYPWGANWAARRDSLRQMGGFRARFGRQGSSLAGGEEIAAAALMQEMGYAVYIAPGAVVRHHVDAERFTWRYVWRNIRANRHTWYKLQKEGYIRWDLGWRNAWRRLSSATAQVGSESPFKPFFTLSAEIAAAGWQLGDFLRRLRGPWRRRCR